MGSKFPLQFIVVGLIKFLAIVELGQRLKQGTLTIVTFLNGLNERCSIPAGCDSGHQPAALCIDRSNLVVVSLAIVLLLFLRSSKLVERFPHYGVGDLWVKYLAFKYRLDCLIGRFHWRQVMIRARCPASGGGMSYTRRNKPGFPFWSCF